MNKAVEIGRASARARRLYPRSDRFQGAYVAGARAALNSNPIDVCPYKRERGKKTWRSAYRHAWILGWQSVVEPEDVSLL